MGTVLFIIYSFIIFAAIAAGALYWYLNSVSLSYEDLYEKAMIALQKNDCNQAKELFLFSLEQKPDFKKSKFNLGKTFVKLEDYDNAKKCFEEILEKEPENFDSLYNLGLVHFKSEDYLEARQCFEKILETEPNNFKALYNLALTCQMQKSYEEAQEFYIKALQEKENDTDCHFNLGLISFRHKKYEEALELFEKANATSTGRADIMFYILRCKDELCNYETAEEGENIVKEYLKISKLSNIPLEFDIFWARAYAKTGKIAKALEICNRALVSLPEDSLAYITLGLIKFIKNELEEAKKALLTAIDLDANNPESYNILSYIFLQQENHIDYITFKNKYEELILPKHSLTSVN